MNHHLSEEQIADLLAGEAPGVATRQHLVCCARCRAEVDDLQTAMRDFGQVSMHWAQAEAPRRVRVPSRLSLHLGGRPGWGLGMATLTVAAVVACSLHMTEKSQPASAVSAAQVEPPTTTDLAQDNRLLRSIDAELTFEATSATVQAGSADTLAHGHRPFRRRR